MNKILEERRQREKQHEALVDEKLREYAKQKEAMAEERRRREDEKFQKAQAMRQKMIDKQVAYLQSLRQKEGRRLNRQQREQQAKADHEAQMKLDKFQREMQVHLTKI